MWKCTCKTHIFTESECNLLYPTDLELNDIHNLTQIVNEKNVVSIYNYTYEI